MAFVLARPPSPAPRDTEEDALSAALRAALQPFSTSTGLQSNPQHGSQSPHPSYTPQTDDMQLRDKAEKGHPFVDISVNSDTLILRGTGVDVEPALLSGNVVLYLSEPTSIKEITLQFRGKARIPPSANESLALNSSPLTYIVCNHEWSFLEGNKSHSHTLKAGRHLFPFQLHIGGSLPSSISTTALGGASVHYKLRATVVRPMGFALTHRDLHAAHAVHIVRGFGPEALEYQQTLEIENTWPEKLMYSIMIPHKAWAAGDRVTAVVKFSPLVKGARVQSVTTMVNETVKLFGRGGAQETTRTIATTRHELVGRDAVCVDEQHHRYRLPLLYQHAHSPAGPAALSRTASYSALSPASHAPHSAAASGFFPPPTHSPGEMAPLTTVTTNSSGSSASGSGGPSGAPSGGSSSSVGLPPATSTTEPEGHPPSGIELPPELEMEPSSDVVTTLSITVPVHATPGHTLEPIQVSHRIRWSIMIGNLDGHTSELRCSLPIHVLDHRLYEEAHAATLQTRRLLLGAADVEGGQAVGTHGDTNSGDEEDMELPSYPAHVRDRVANAYLPDAGVMRVTNPWVAQGISPVISTLPQSESSSGVQSPAPLECFPVNGAANGNGNAHTNANGNANGAAAAPRDPRSQLPHVPSPDTQQLHWVNSELLLSLGPEQPPASQAQRSPVDTRPPSRTPPESAGPSRHGSRFPSRRASRAPSRAGSRAGSPERSDASSVASAGSAETYVHNSSTASRNLHGLFHISMKPFTSITGGLSLGHRSTSASNLAAGCPHGHSHLAAGERASRLSSGASTPTSSGMNTPAPALVAAASPRRHLTQDQILLHRAFIETPDYETASRGFLGGGVPPLSSYNGLPSYEEAEEEGRAPGRCRSEPDIAGMHGHGHGHGLSMSSIHAQMSPIAQTDHSSGRVTVPTTPPRHSLDT